MSLQASSVDGRLEAKAVDQGVRLTTSELVESIGFGKAQLLVFIAGAVVLFNRGVHMCLMAVLTTPIAREFGLTSTQQGLLSSGVFAGMFVGTFASGLVGDRVGRRFPVCTSSIMVVAIGCLSTLSVSFEMLLAMRILLGAAMALGDVPATVLFSEVSPQRWRIPIRAASEGTFDVGYTYVAFLASFADPYLRALRWRRLLLLASIPPGVMGVLSALLLPESPVYLASCGRREEAMRVFRMFRRLNNVPHVSVDYAPDAQEQRSSGQRGGLSPLEQLGLVFGRRFFRISAILVYIAFAVNMFYYGGMYLQPQVMTKGLGLAPGWEMIIGGPFDVCGLVAAMGLATAIPRKHAICFSLAMAAVGSFCFGFAGSVKVRRTGMEVMYQFGVFGYYWVPAMCFVVFSQLCVESFPTAAASTGGSIAFCSGRLGAMAGPMLFERIRDATGSWSPFCYVSAALCALAVLLLLAEGGMSQDPTTEDPSETVPCKRNALADAEEGSKSKSY